VTCDDVLKALGSRLADATCFQSADLTTNNPLTTPANNSLRAFRRSLSLPSPIVA